jgi:hypothetical protein
MNAAGTGAQSSEASATPAVAGTGGGTNLITNGSFETPSVSSGLDSAPTTASTGWTWVSGPGAGMSGNVYPIEWPTPAPDGVQVAYLINAGSVSQTVSGLTIGHTYTVAFSTAESTGAAANPLNAQIDGTTALSVTPGAAWASSSFTFTATATSHTLGFVGTSSSGARVCIDAVSMTA